MTTFGYFLSSEDHPPRDLVEQARMAEDAGFTALWISDHYHPWNDAQGQSPFVRSVIGALSQATTLPVTTAVTCPTVRIHPAVVAQAAATSAVALDGRFVLGVGSGEALNEHILGSYWPPADMRLDMLREAVEVIRTLLTGEQVSHVGTHYRVDNARIYTLPTKPVPIYVSGFGPKAIELAAEIGDGYISTKPDADSVAAFRQAGGRGPAQGGVKVCWGPDRDEAVATAHRLWANTGVPGEGAQVLPTPAHFEQASSLVTPAQLAEKITCGPDVAAHVTALEAYVDAGYDEVYVSQIGPDQKGFFDVYAREVLPALR